MNRSAKSTLLAAYLLAFAPLSHAVFTVEGARFDGCLGAGCVFEIADNSALDNNAASEVIDFSPPIVAWVAARRALAVASSNRLARMAGDEQLVSCCAQ